MIFVFFGKPLTVKAIRLHTVGVQAGVEIKEVYQMNLVPVLLGAMWLVVRLRKASEGQIRSFSTATNGFFHVSRDQRPQELAAARGAAADINFCGRNKCILAGLTEGQLSYHVGRSSGQLPHDLAISEIVQKQLL